MVSLQGASILCWPAWEVLCFDGGRRGFAQMLGGMVHKNIVIEAWLVFLNSSPCKPEGPVWGLREEVVKARTKEDTKGGRCCHEMQGQHLLMDWGRSSSSRPTPENSKQFGALSPQPTTVQNRPSLSLRQQRQWWGAVGRGLQERGRGKAEGPQAWRWALRATLTWHWGKSLCCRTRLGARGLHRKPTQQHLRWQGETTVAKKHFQIEW